MHFGRVMPRPYNNTIGRSTLRPYKKHKIMEEKKTNNKFELILKIIIAVASAIAGALGATACQML